MQQWGAHFLSALEMAIFLSQFSRICGVAFPLHHALVYLEEPHSSNQPCALDSVLLATSNFCSMLNFSNPWLIQRQQKRKTNVQ